ncbi:EF-hand domain-containing protein [Phaeobacter sp. QD34_3]|uniref:EF-hand domain-containing protein n=1 Tax=unclassified Phaeobacter TaxID=2621772 RepID=UPI00237FA74F|nr:MULTISPECIES: EF-hand domain-containing protein [unclassified Phaeobacter]MDE4133813.1 EF-hand domain-containing protein [Phaeobacter sp. QD34_3]MDE4137495.1 EF-hand domain-containing protein [Phaeobacter sp. QD34_24]
MKHSHFMAAIVAVAGLAGASAALAQPGAGHHGPRVTFEELDADGNGEVSKAEMEAHRTARFAATDTDGDGKLSAEEIIAEGHKRAEKRAAQMIERHDSDGDGALSQEELPMPGKHGDMFSRLDSDGSGAISKAEFEEMRMHKRGKHHKGRDCGQKPGQGMEQN